MTEEKIKPPAHFTAGQERKASRQETLGELKGWLTRKHEQVLDSDPYAPFAYRLPTDFLKNLDEDEKAALRAHEEQAHARLRPIAQEKRDQLRAFTMAGGSAEAFEEHWRDGGRELHVASVADETLERAKRASSPY